MKRTATIISAILITAALFFSAVGSAGAVPRPDAGPGAHHHAIVMCGHYKAYAIVFTWVDGRLVAYVEQEFVRTRCRRYGRPSQHGR